MIELCASHEIPDGASRGLRHKQLSLVLVRQAGHLYAYRNRCPHRGTPLEWQPDAFLDDSGRLIQCAAHGALFLVENGECIAGPCQGEFLEPVAVEEREGAVWLLAGPGRDI